MTPEAKVKTKVKRILADHGILPDEGGPSGWYFMPVAGRFGRRGAADFICNVQGHFLAVETKANGGVETDLQVLVRKGIVRSRGTAIVIDEHNLDDLASYLEDLMEAYCEKSTE